MGTAMAPTLEVQVARVFEDIPQVESVYVVPRGNNRLKVWTVVNEEDDAVYSAIYQRELGLLHRFTQALIDFNVITRHNRPVREFVGTKTLVWERTVASESGQPSSMG